MYLLRQTNVTFVVTSAIEVIINIQALCLLQFVRLIVVTLAVVWSTSGKASRTRHFAMPNLIVSILRYCGVYVC